MKKTRSADACSRWFWSFKKTDLFSQKEVYECMYVLLHSTQQQDC